MAAPLSLECVSKIATFKFISPLAFLRQCKHINNSAFDLDVGCKLRASAFVNRVSYLSTVSCSSITRTSVHATKPLLPGTALEGLKPALAFCLVPSRHYGHKMRQRPPKISNFEYSGDLRNLPELDKSTLLYKYRGMEKEMEGNDVVKKLCSIEHASAKEIAEHKKQLVVERITHLFGPDSEMEQKIALKTLMIRQLIPYCIKYRTDKVNKSALVRTIGSRRNLLTKLRETDHERFEWLLRELKIRYVIPKDREEYKGWKHNFRVAKQDEATDKRRNKLEELKAKFEAEKKTFFEHKAKILAQIEEDLKNFGLTREFLDQQIAREKEILEMKQRDLLLQAKAESIRQKRK